MAKQPAKKNSSNKNDAKIDEDLLKFNIPLPDELILQHTEAMDELYTIKVKEEPEGEILKPKEIIPKKHELTKEELAKQHEEAIKKLQDFYTQQTGKEGEIKYYNLEPNSKTAMGSFNEQNNTLVVGNLSKFENEPMMMERVLQHEQHHRLFAHSKITTSDGKEVLARQAPMSMAQHYKLEQADEIGSKITELMAMRQRYVEANGAAEKSRQSARMILASHGNDENTAKLLTALEKGTDITRNGTKYKFKDGDKEIEVDLKDKPCQTLNTYIKKQKEFKNLDTEMKTEWTKDKDTGWYWKDVANGRLKPLSTEAYDMQREMDAIGSGVASNWNWEYSKDYAAQCTNRTKSYFDEHNFQEIKANNDNYDKALSAALTVGGWDFSSAVKGHLSAPENIQKIDEQIAKGENESKVIEKAEKLGISLQKNYSTSNDSIEVRIAAKIAGDEKITGVKEKITERPFIWDEKQESHFKTAMENLEKLNLPEKDKQEIQKLRQELGWDNKKKGETVTPEEMEKLDALTTKISKTYNSIFETELKKNKKAPTDWNNYSQYYSNLYALEKDYNIKNVTEQERAQYEKIYNKVKKEGDRPFDEIDIVSVQKYISEIRSGIEQGRPADKFNIRTDYMKEYNDARLITSKHHKDFSQPFLTEYYKALQNKEAKQALERVNNVVKGKQQLAQEAQSKEQQATAQNMTTQQQNTATYAQARQNSR